MLVLVSEVLILTEFFYFSHFVQLNLIGHCHGLSVEETKDLWVQADINGNGVIDYKGFLVK